MASIWTTSGCASAALCDSVPSTVMSYSSKRFQAIPIAMQFPSLRAERFLVAPHKVVTFDRARFASTECRLDQYIPYRQPRWPIQWAHSDCPGRPGRVKPGRPPAPLNGGPRRAEQGVPSGAFAILDLYLRRRTQCGPRQGQPLACPLGMRAITEPSVRETAFSTTMRNTMAVGICEAWSASAYLCALALWPWRTCTTR